MKRMNTPSINESEESQLLLHDNCEHKNADEEINHDSEEHQQSYPPLRRGKCLLEPYIDNGCNSPKTMN